MRAAINSIMNMAGLTPESLDEQIAECKEEITELEGDGTIISKIISFAQETGKAMFSSASSSDNSKKDPEEKEKKLTELKAKLAELMEKKKAQGADAPSSDSPDELGEDELKGDLADYVNQLKEAGTPYEVVRGKGGMIGIRTTAGGDSNSMMGKFGGAIKSMMDTVAKDINSIRNASFLDKLSEEERLKLLSDLKNPTAGSSLGDEVKSQVRDVIPSMGGMVSGFDDVKSGGQNDRSWYEDDQLLDATSKGLSERSNAELFAATPIGQNQEAIDLMQLQVSSAKETAARGRTALMPVQIGDNHWVGGAMTKEGDKFKFIHNDPFGDEIDPNLRDVLESQGVDVIDLRHKQQTDVHNCGPYTADNLSKFAEAIENKKESGLSDEEFKEGLKAELRSDGDQIRQEQQGRSYSPQATPTVPGLGGVSAGR